MEKTHRLQVVDADGELSETQQQVQLCAQVGDVAHLHQRGVEERKAGDVSVCNKLCEYRVRLHTQLFPCDC